MRRGVTWTTSAADEILRCRCRADESWLANCSRAVVQRLQSSDRRAVCWSVERSTCRSRPIGAGDGRRERQDMLQLHHAAPCRPGGPAWTRLVVGLEASGVASTLVWCGHVDECRWRAALPRSAQTVGAWTDCLWFHWTVLLILAMIYEMHDFYRAMLHRPRFKQRK